MTIPTYARMRQYRRLASLRGRSETREEYLDEALLYSYKRSREGEHLTFGGSGDTLVLSREEAAVGEDCRDPVTCFSCGATLVDDAECRRDEQYDVSHQHFFVFAEHLLRCTSCGWWFHSTRTEYRVSAEHNGRKVDESFYTATYGVRDEYDVCDDALPIGELREWLRQHPQELQHLPRAALLNVVAEGFRNVYRDAAVSILDERAGDGAHIRVTRASGVPMLVRVADDRRTATSAADIAVLERALERQNVRVGKLVAIAGGHSDEASAVARASTRHIQLLDLGDVTGFLQSRPRAGTERWYELRANLDQHTYRDAFASSFFRLGSLEDAVAREGDCWYYELTWGKMRSDGRGPIPARMRLGGRRTAPVISRVAAVLLELGERYGVRRSRGVIFPFRLTNDQIGEMVGACRATVNVALNLLWDDHLIDMKTAYIGVVDIAGLAAVAIAGAAHISPLPVVSRPFLEARNARRARFAERLATRRQADAGSRLELPAEVTTQGLTPQERFAVFWEAEKRALQGQPVTVEPFSLWGLLRELERRSVTFVLVASFVSGGSPHARGAPRFGVLVRPEDVNVVRALEALEAMGARVRHLDVAALLEDDMLLPVASGGIRIDLITSVPGVPDAFERAVAWDYGEGSVRRMCVDERLTAGAR